MRAPTGRSHGLAHVLDWAVGRGARREKLLTRIAVEPALLAEPNVFHRAFKRWTGETAASHRARSREKRG